MKYPYLVLAAMVSSFGLWACGDDPKPSQGSDDPSSSATIGGGDTPAESSSSAIKVDDPNAAITTVPNQNVATTSISLTGSAAVGPMKKGTTISVTGIDPSSFAAMGTAAQATVSTDNGDFTLSGSVGSPYVTVSATGSYYNYILDESYGPVTLDAVANVTGKTSLNVNVLTHVEAARVKTLVTANGMTFNDAKIKAEKEIRLAFGLPSDSTLFEDISITSGSQAGANLLAVTSALMGELDGTSFNSFLKYITEDIAADGTWDDESAKAKFGDDAFGLPVNPSVLSLKAYVGKPVSYFEREIAGFWGVQYGLGFCVEDGVLATCSNTKSTNSGKSFMCSEGKWSIVTEDILNSIALVPVLGECTSANEGVMKDNAGTYYTCKKKFWVKASADEIANSMIAATAGACDDTKYSKIQTYNSKFYVCVPPAWTPAAHTPVDYSKGRAMNKKLGKGINFGNSWDAPSSNDAGWSNPIDPSDFAKVKAAGFNSVRIPVRWYTGMDSKLSGVKSHVTAAINAGLVVIINYHHYEPMLQAAKSGGSTFTSKLSEFSGEWKKIAQNFDSFADDMLVFEVFNEPHDISADAVDKIMNTGYEAIRSVSKGKTIMFEGNDYAKFSQVAKVSMPADGNIIFTGHYYEPYTFSHQGSHSGDGSCSGDAAYASKATADLKEYTDKATIAYPDLNGGHIPLNMGEFGVAKVCGVSDTKRAQWTKNARQAAEANGMSWHYWCFKNCGGFEAYNGSWMGGFLDAFGL